MVSKRTKLLLCVLLIIAAIMAPIRITGGDYIRDALDEWIDELAVYECNGCPANFRILDRNLRYSYGFWQFQEETFSQYTQRYGIAKSREEALAMIYDETVQRKLVRLMIEENPNNWKHWATSVRRGLGEPPQDL